MYLSGNLKLQDLFSEHEGTYMCKGSSAEETLITDILLSIVKVQKTISENSTSVAS